MYRLRRNGEATEVASFSRSGSRKALTRVVWRWVDMRREIAASEFEYVRGFFPVRGCTVSRALLTFTPDVIANNLVRPAHADFALVRRKT